MRNPINTWLKIILLSPKPLRYPKKGKLYSDGLNVYEGKKILPFDLKWCTG